MAVYSVGMSTDGSVIAGIKAALTSAGVLTTTHYETTNRLIVTTTLSNKVLRVVAEYARPSFYYGDSWVSGDAVVNQVSLNPYNWGTSDSMAVIIKPPVLAFSWHNTSNIISGTLFSKLAVNNKYFAMGWVTPSSTATTIRNTSDDDNVDVHTLGYYPTIISGEGYYYQTDLIVTTSGGVLLASGIQGVKWLARDYVTVTPYQVYGDDVALSGGSAKSIVNYLTGSLLIPGGSL